MPNTHDIIAAGIAKELRLKLEILNNKPSSTTRNHESWYYFRWKKRKLKPTPHTQHHSRLIILHNGKIYMGPSIPTDPISDLADPNLIENVKTALATWTRHGRPTQ